MSGSTPPRGWRQIVADPSVRPARLPQADSQDSTRGLVTNHQQSRADRAVVEQAARPLRDRAIADGYAGYEGKHLAFGMALVLHELARHLRDLQTTLDLPADSVSSQLSAR